jgi:hypothetical protein
VANRLARTPSDWINTFIQFRSYTHNNQWLIIDLNKYKTEKKTEILMVEEGFDIFYSTNFTDKFYKDGYIASYNIPFNETIYNKLNYSACKIPLIQTVMTTIMIHAPDYSDSTMSRWLIINNSKDC